MPEFDRKTEDIYHSGKMSVSEFSGVNTDLYLLVIQKSVFLIQSFQEGKKVQETVPSRHLRQGFFF